MLCKDAAEAKDKKRKCITSPSEQTWTTSHPSKSKTRQVILSILNGFLAHRTIGKDQQPSQNFHMAAASRESRGDLVPPV